MGFKIFNAIGNGVIILFMVLIVAVVVSCTVLPILILNGTIVLSGLGI
ncbi:MAG: hypothetical protein ABIQ44_03375 [Chloroflexia bacterium]